MSEPISIANESISLMQLLHFAVTAAIVPGVWMLVKRSVGMRDAIEIKRESLLMKIAETVQTISTGMAVTDEWRKQHAEEDDRRFAETSKAFERLESRQSETYGFTPPRGTRR